jgi:N-acetyl-gamma-glutamyl-phosphate reductase
MKTGVEGQEVEKRSPVVVVGANGYSGEELVGRILRHPGLELVAITSRQHAGKGLGEVLPRFGGVPGAELEFMAPEPERLAEIEAAIFFLALPHGVAAGFAEPLLKAGRRVVDISADFRLREAALYAEFYGGAHPAPALLAEAVYGLPEVYREKIRSARLVAAPGCYPTSILLPLLPLLRAGLVEVDSISVCSASGVSGAGRKADETLLFAECNESLRAYGLPKHRHLSEIEQELSLAASEPVRITFVPHLAPMNRGIHTTIVARPRAGVTEEMFWQTWIGAYESEPFVRVGASLPETKNVRGTNFCDLSLRWDGRTGRVILLSAEDNLVKGAGGQALQAANLMLGWPETMGLW